MTVNIVRRINLKIAINGNTKEIIMGLFSKKVREYNDIKMIDLSKACECTGTTNEMCDNVEVDYPLVKGANKNSLYLGHPDSALLDNGDILVAYPLGHGKGETVMKRSCDGGLTWSKRFEGLPKSFVDTMETPTIYKLNFANGDQKLVMISGRPTWGKPFSANGFDATLSTSLGADGKCDGVEWSSHENYYGCNATNKKHYAPKGKWNAIVAMASLTQVKDSDGNFIDKWMGIFHNVIAVPHTFDVCKTFLTFDENGNMDWSKPTSVLIEKKAKEMETKYQFCEPEVVRSPDGKEIAMIFRTNAKKSFSCVSFSTDEGQSWSMPQSLSREITGERHKAEYDPITGKLVVSCRNIDWLAGKDFEDKCWMSHGLVAWVGDYADLHNGADGKGDVLIKLAHTYKKGQKNIELEADDDTGYAGVTIDAEGNAVIISYGKFTARCRDTYIIAKRFNVAEVLEILKK